MFVKSVLKKIIYHGFLYRSGLVKYAENPRNALMLKRQIYQRHQYQNIHKGIYMEYIPEITNDRITKLLKQMQPIIEKDQKFFSIKKVDPRKTAFTWDPKRKKEIKNIEPIRTVETYHTWAFYGFFKPTIAEVLAQLPADIEKEIVAFKTEMKPHNNWRETLAGPMQEYHIGHTTFYRKRK